MRPFSACLDLHTPHDDSPPIPCPPVQLIRRWSPALLEPAAPPLFCHNHPVRALAAGGKQLVVSGDKGGEVAVWKVA